jgi:hypothetical protein
VYGGRELRRGIRQREIGYVMAVRVGHSVTVGSGCTMTAAAAVGIIPGPAWHRMRTGSVTKGTRHYDWAMLEVASDDTPAGHGDGHSVLLAGQVIRWKSWHRWTTICLLAYIYLAVAVAVQCQQEAGSDSDTGLILVTVPELLRLLRDVVIPPPRRDRAYRLHWSEWRRRHQCRARQAHRHWNAYAETAP